jgi:hypothetical protein
MRSETAEIGEITLVFFLPNCFILATSELCALGSKFEFWGPLAKNQPGLPDYIPKVVD